MLQSIAQVVQSLAQTSTPLLAVNEIAVGAHVLSLHLPNNQWQLELNYWHSIAMAQFQRTIIQWATGQIAPEPQFLLQPQTEPDTWFCKNLAVAFNSLPVLQCNRSRLDRRFRYSSNRDQSDYRRHDGLGAGAFWHWSSAAASLGQASHATASV